MKLLRLSTYDETGLFNVNFTDDIKLKEFSKIALQNLAIEPQFKVFEINNHNNDLVLTFGERAPAQTPEYNVQLTNGTYTFDNHDAIIKDLEQNINLALPMLNGTSVNLGSSFRVGTDKNKLTLEMKTVDANDPLTGKFNIVSNASTASSKVKRAGGTVGDYDSYITNSKLRMGKGQCIFRCQPSILTLNAGPVAGENGFIIGLTKRDIPSGETLTTNDFVLAIHVQEYTNSVHKIYSNGATYTNIANASTSAATLNTQFWLVQNEGKLQAWQFRATGGGSPDALLYEIPDYDYYTNDLYPVICMVGDAATCELKIVKYLYDPFQAATLTIDTTDALNLVEDVSSLTIPSQRKGRNYSYDFNLSTADQNLADFLGFYDLDLLQNNYTAPVINLGFTVSGPNSFMSYNLSENIIVEMLNIPINSYINYTDEEGERASILAAVPVELNDDGILQYEVNNLIFLDMENINEIFLRNIKCRLLKGDGTPVFVKGNCYLTIIFN